MLTNRPLYATAADQAIFVATDATTAFVEAVQRGRNTLLEGDRGSGKTTVLHVLELKLREQKRPVLFVSLEQVDTVEQAALVLYRSAADAGWISSVDNDLVESALTGRDPLVANQLIRALEVVPEAAVFLVDGIGGEVGHRLFGRLRDELWQLERVWGVAVETSQVAMLLRPPADAFFEVRIRLAPFDTAHAVELLQRRRTRLPDTDLMLLTIDASTPRQLIDAARRVVDSGDKPATVALGNERRRARAAEVGGRPAAMLVAELENLGPVSAGDETLLARMGWTRPRAATLLRKLEEAGVVEAHREARKGPGQPRKVYGLRDAAAFLEGPA